MISRRIILTHIRETRVAKVRFVEKQSALFLMEGKGVYGDGF